MRRLILLAIFVGLPILEIYVIIQVGQVIGAVPTVLLLIFESILGAWLIKHEGRRAWNALQETLATGKMPGKELADAALVLVGGTLLLTPGFVTDIFGFFFILPFTRPLARRVLDDPGRPADRRQRTDHLPATRRSPAPPEASPDSDGVYDIYREDDR